MSDYRRYFVPGGTYFFTLVSYQRRPRFASPSDIQRLREAVAFVQREQPFRFLAAVATQAPRRGCVAAAVLGAKKGDITDIGEVDKDNE